jgi:hypothetical protein
VVHAEKNNGATESRSNSGKKILTGAQDHGEADKNKSLAAALLALGKRKPGHKTEADEEVELLAARGLTGAGKINPWRETLNWT